MNSSSDTAGDDKSLDQPEAPEPNVTSLPTNTQLTRPRPNDPTNQTSTPTAFLKQRCVTESNVDLAAKQIKPPVEEHQQEKRQKTLQQPSRNITSVLGQERSEQGPQPLSSPYNAPGVKPQSNNSRLSRRRRTGDPLRSPTLQTARRTASSPKTPSAPARPKLILDQPLLKQDNYVGSRIPLKTATKTTEPTTTEATKSTQADKLTKPIPYDRDHPLYPKIKPTKRSPIKILREQLKDRQKLATPTTSTGKSEQQLPQDTQNAIKEDVRLQKQIITKAGSTPAKPSTH